MRLTTELKMNTKFGKGLSSGVSLLPQAYRCLLSPDGSTSFIPHPLPFAARLCLGRVEEGDKGEEEGAVGQA